MAEKRIRGGGRRETLYLRGTNGILYKMPTDLLEPYAVPPEEFDEALRAIGELNPPLGREEGRGVGIEALPGAAAGQVVINIYTAPAAPPVPITPEAEAAMQKMYDSRIFSVRLAGPARSGKAGEKKG